MAYTVNMLYIEVTYSAVPVIFFTASTVWGPRVAV